MKVEARWEGAVHKTIMTGGRLGPHQCWRYMEGGLMAICSSVLCSRGECVMHWYLELITEPERLLCNPDGELLGLLRLAHVPGTCCMLDGLLAG